MTILQRQISAVHDRADIKADPVTAENVGRIATAASALDGYFAQMQGAGLPRGEEKARLRHDLRSKLNLILGYAELVEEDLEDRAPDPPVEALKAIQLAARDLVVSVDALVDLDEVAPDVAARADWRDVGPVGAVRTALTGRILLVDDSASTRDLAERYLTPQGHEVAQAASGEEALALLDDAPFDLVLLDMIMPGLSGLEVLERLKSPESRHWTVPVIVISGLSDMASVAPCIAAGAEDYLTKPFNPVLLRARIESCLQKKAYADREAAFLHRIEAEKAKTDAILSAILPASIIERLHRGEYPIADHCAQATVLFADIVGFTDLSARIAPKALVAYLDTLFSGFDALAVRHGVEKIKTIGDAYMACCGVSEPCADHAARCAALASDMMGLVRARTPPDGAVALRIGLHSGPVIAGLIGRERYAFDIWGETVNCASRIESIAPAGSVCVSSATAAALRPDWALRSLGPHDLRGIGRQEVFEMVHTKAKA